MGRVHKALMKSQEEGRDNLLERLPEKRSNYLPQVQIVAPVVEASEWFKELYAKLRTQRSTDELKVILFTGVSEGCGSTSTAAGFASSLAKAFQHNVLLIDANLRNPAMNRIFDETSAHFLAELSELHAENQPTDRAERGRLFIITCDEANPGETGLLGSESFLAFLKQAREVYDYIILDAPPVSSFPESKILSAAVDGVVLVVLAGKTRKHVMLKAQIEIERAQGHLVGVILNRRKHYIPKWLYQWI